MPGLPVNLRIALAALGLGLAFAFSAEAAVVVRSIDDLRKGQEIQDLDGTFQSVSAGNIVYTQCVAPLGITPQQQEYQKQLFTTTAAKYTQAYYDVYVQKVGAPPPQNVIDYIVKYVSDEEQNAVTRMDAFVKAHGCGNIVVRKIYENIETMHQKEDAAKANAQKPTDPWSK